MNTKKFFITLFFFSLLVVAAVIVYAQVEKQIRNTPEKAGEKNDAPTLPDNKEGLSELNHIIDRYKGANMVLTGEINYYENIDSANTLSETARFTSVSTAWANSFEIDSILSINQDGKTLIVDKRDKSMSLHEQEPDPNEKNAVSLKQDLGAELDQFLGFIYSIQAISKGNEKMLSITFNENAPFNINNYDVFYNPETYRVTRIRIEMLDGDITDSPEEIIKEGDKEELVFVDSLNNEVPTGYYARISTNAYEVIYKTERTVKPGYIDLENFVSKNADGEYTPAGEFRHYELTN